MLTSTAPSLGSQHPVRGPSTLHTPAAPPGHQHVLARQAQAHYLQYQSGRGRLAHRTQGVIRHTGVSAESIFGCLLDSDRPIFQQVPARVLRRGEGGSCSVLLTPLLTFPSANPKNKSQGGWSISWRCPNRFEVPFPASKPPPQTQSREKQVRSARLSADSKEIPISALGLSLFAS